MSHDPPSALPPCRYDAHGKSALSPENMMDPSEVFGVLFGSELFEDYVGQLQLATVAAMTPEDPDKAQQPQTQEEMQLKMQVRAGTCCVGRKQGEGGLTA